MRWDEYPCHRLDRKQWCDLKGSGDFMGHTCVNVSQHTWSKEKEMKFCGNEIYVGTTGESRCELSIGHQGHHKQGTFEWFNEGFNYAAK